MKKGIIITITLCFLVFLSLSVYSIVGHNAENIWPGIFYGDFTVDGLLNVTGNIISDDPVDSNHVATKSYVDANGGGGDSSFPGCGSYIVPTSFPESVESYSIGVVDDNDCNKVDYDSNNSFFYPETIGSDTWYFTAVPLVEKGKWGYTRDGKSFTRLNISLDIPDFTMSTAYNQYFDIGFNPYDNKTYAVGSYYKSLGSYDYRCYVRLYKFENGSWTSLHNIISQYDGDYLYQNPRIAFKDNGNIVVAIGRTRPSYSDNNPYTQIYEYDGSSSQLLVSEYVDYATPYALEVDENNNILFVQQPTSSNYYLKMYDGSSVSSIASLANTPSGNAVLVKSSNSDIYLLYGTGSIYYRPYNSTTQTLGTQKSFSSVSGYSKESFGDYGENNFKAFYDKNDDLWVATVGRKTVGDLYERKMFFYKLVDSTFERQEEYDLYIGKNADSGMSFQGDVILDKNGNINLVVNKFEGNSFSENFRSFVYDDINNKWKVLSLTREEDYYSNLFGAFLSDDRKTLNYMFFTIDSSGNRYVSSTNVFSSHEGKCFSLRGEISNSNILYLRCPDEYEIKTYSCLESSTNIDCYTVSDSEIYLKGYDTAFSKASMICCK